MRNCVNVSKAYPLTVCCVPHDLVKLQWVA